MSSFQCVICQRRVSYEVRLPELYPFCSPRCKLVDLGCWFNEGYTIERDLSPEDDAPPADRPPLDRD